MGRVYEAVRISDERRIALKILHPHLAALPGPVARFRREVEIASKLPTERVARVFELGTTGRPGLEYIAMELLSGEDLASCLRREGRLSVGQTTQMVDQISHALEVAAAEGIVHRDVKPRNIFLVRADAGGMDARLLDFGICRLQDGALGDGVTQSAAILGTPGFLAPEQVTTGFGEVGSHTDVFALGCVVYRALAGRNAFAANDVAGAVYEVLNHHPIPIRKIAPELPEAVEWVLSVALAKHTADRYRGAGELARDLRLAATGAVPERIAERALLLNSKHASVNRTLAT